jgi:hypothetical protein
MMLSAAAPLSSAERRVNWLTSFNLFKVKVMVSVSVKLRGAVAHALTKRLPICFIRGRMDESSITQNRRSNRSPVLLSAKVDVDGAEVAVVLRNLSAEGALIEGSNLPSEGIPTVFRRNELCVKGHIVWVEGRFAGLRFERHLNREELLRQVPQPRQKFEPQYRRPGLACRPLTDADRQMIEMWKTPLELRRS